MTFADLGYMFVFLPLVLTLYHFFRATPWANAIMGFFT